MKYLPDEYTVRARIFPGLVVIMSAVLATFAWPVDGEWGWKAMSLALESTGGVALLGQLGGYLGKKHEPRLFAVWGGRPSERLLSYAGKADLTQVQHWHDGLRRVTGLEIPSQQDELNNPFEAYKKYEAAVSALRNKVRSQTPKGSVSFSNNCDYGFRRNTWAMRWWGLFFTVVGLGILGLKFYLHIRGHQPVPPALFGVCGLLFLILAFWIWVNPNWIRQAADRYAISLFDTLDMM